MWDNQSLIKENKKYKSGWRIDRKERGKIKGEGEKRKGKEKEHYFRDMVCGKKIFWENSFWICKLLFSNVVF